MNTDELNIRISAETGSAAHNIDQTAKSLDNLKDAATGADVKTSDLVDAMARAASNMVQISQNIANSAAGLTQFQGGIDAVSSALQGISFRFDTLNASIQQSYTAFDSAAGSVSSLASASESSATALNGIVTATDGFSDRMSDLQTNTDGTAHSMADLQKELSDALQTVSGFADSMSTAGKDAETTSAKIRDLSEEVEQLVRSSKSGSTATLSLANGFKQIKGVIATLGVAKFVKDSNDAYITQMQNELKLASHMKHRMNATDDEIRAVKELASAQQKLGVIGDEIQLAGAQQLTTYARQSSTLQTLIPAMNNLIAQNAGYSASVGDATSAADMLGRALNGQYTSLKRMGVTFTDAQEEILKYGNESQKAAVLADAINSKVGNMNELLAQTPTGKYKQLQNELGDLQEEIGATFQPLITAIVPVIRGAMETLTPPILNVSRGISTIGAAIASIDSPAVRGIALAAGALAVVNKLKLAIGGTSAGLLLLGVVLAGIVGSMQKEQETVGDIVNNAMQSAEKATDNAKDSMSEYTDETEKAQKTLNSLAGFDTITKLSSGTKGVLTTALLGDTGLDDIAAATDAAGDLQDTLDKISTPDLDLSNIDWSKIPAEIERYLKSINWNEIETGAINFLNSVPWSTIFETVGNGLVAALRIGSRGAKSVLLGFASFVKKHDWKKDFLVIGDAYTDVFSAALGTVDAILNTHFQEWYEKYRQKQFDKGYDFQKGINYEEYGRQAAEQYQADNGESTSATFKRLYQGGMSAEDAFNYVYTSQALKDAFFALDANEVKTWVDEWKNLSNEDLMKALNPASYSRAMTKEGIDTLLSGGWGSMFGYATKSLFGNAAISGNAYGDIYGDDYAAMVQEYMPQKQTSRLDVPTRTASGIPSNVPVSAYTDVTVIINGEERKPDAVRVNNGRG